MRKTNLYKYVLYWTVWLRILRRRTGLDLVATRDAAGMFSRASLDEVKLVTISEQCQCCNLTYQRPHDGYEGEVVPGEEEGVPQQGQGGGAGQVQQVAAGAGQEAGAVQQQRGQHQHAYCHYQHCQATFFLVSGQSKTSILSGE